VTYQPSTSDRLIDDPQFPDEIDAREAAQLLDLAHAEWERDWDADMDEYFSDPAVIAEQERRAATGI
jgi:hypothetical protein